MDYVDNVQKSVFFLEQMLRQQEMKRYIQECQIFASGKDIGYKLNTLNEDLKESAKGLWTKIKTIFTRIWLKFLERIDKFCKDDAEYLKQYQNIILNKKAPEGTYKMPDYTRVTARCFEKMPEFEQYVPTTFVDDIANKIKEHADEEDADARKRKWEIAIQNKFKPKEMPEIKEDTDFTSACKEWYGGGEDEDISSDAINMADAYNICFSAKTVIDELSKTQVKYDKWITDVEKKYNAAYKTMADLQRQRNDATNKATQAYADGDDDARKTHTADANAAAQKIKDIETKNTEVKQEIEKRQAEQQKAKAGTGTNESFDMYSIVYGGTINEASFSSGGSGSSSSDKKDYVHGTGNSVGSDNINKDQANKDIRSAGNTSRAASEKQATNAADQAGISASNAAKDAKDVSADAIKKFTDMVTTYTTVCTTTISTIFGAKCNAIEKMRKDYMFVIRNHVKYWLGRPDSTDDNVKSTKTPGSAPGI